MGRQKTRWSKELVLQRIDKRRAAGLPLNSADVVADDEPLTGAARRLFGSWGNAITAAGLDYEAIKAEARSRPASPPGTWDAEVVTKQIRERAERGEPLNAHAVQIDDSKLYSAAVVHLGSWGKAVEAAGLDYLEYRKTAEWSPEKLIAKIQELYAAGADLSDRNVYLLAGALYGAAFVHFGSWPAAVEAAGIEYQEVSKTTTWSREKVREVALSMVEAGIQVDGKKLPYAFRDYYGSAEELLADIGLPQNEAEPTPNRLRQYRESAGLSQRKLGTMAGKYHTWVRMIEIGRLEPSIGDALRLAKILKVPVEQLFYLDDLAN